ncbi:MAG: hypothetical protein QXP16_03955 [Candidatus Bathyarchaeia archaeon]
MTRLTSRPLHQAKRKYHSKTASDEAIHLTWLRLLDIEPLFTRYVWLNVPVFDLAELGFTILYAMTPLEFEPFLISFDYEMPSLSEVMQGIWINFTPIRLEKLYEWLADLLKYIDENLKPEYREGLKKTIAKKAVYGVTGYDTSYFDPYATRELIRSSFQRLRLLRTPDVSYAETLRRTASTLFMTEETDRLVYNRLMLLYAAQQHSFVLGLSVLGYSRLTHTENGYAKIPFTDSRGTRVEVKFKNLDHLQIGLILGITPLGYGALLPSETIYLLPEGKKNAPFIDVVTEKTRKITHRTTLTAFAYSNYNKPEEMRDPHKSDKTNQYSTLQTMRKHIERLVEASVPPEESNPVRIRQYQNAALQLLSWPAKRHRWGYVAWQAMRPETFKEWWLNNWEHQGLNRYVLEAIYKGMAPWLSEARKLKLGWGERVKRTRRQLAAIS